MKQIVVRDYQTKKDFTYKQWKEYAESGSGEDVDLNFLTQRMLKIFYNISLSDSRALKADQIDRLLSNVLIAINQPISPFTETILMNGVKYGFFDFSKMTYGELVDLDALREDNDWCKIASVCYRKVIKENTLGEYEIESYKGYNDDFKDVPYYYIEGMQQLFMKSWNHLNQIILTSTTQK